MAIIEVIEHQKLKIGNKFDPVKKQISKQDADYLRQLEFKQDKQIFKWGYNTVSPQQWVGVITVPSGTIEVLPKIAENDNVERLREILVHMLQIVHDVPVRKNITANLRYGTQGFLDVLIFLFLTELEKQLRNGMYKTYQKHMQNLNSIKGTVDYPENLRKNVLLKNKFVCKYSKFTEDNLLNQIIRFTLEFLSKVAVSQRNKALIKRLLINFDSVSLKRITENDIDSLIFHRNNLRYQETINFCRLFIKGFALDLKSGEVIIDFMLFDMNHLFERYIYRMYKKALKNGKVVFQYKKNHLLTENSSSSKKVQLKPDLIITTPNKTIVLDTKWKNIRGFADEKDVYQMNAYLDCIPNLDEGILLYPKSTKNDKIVDDYHINATQSTSSLKIRTVDLSMSGENPAFFSYLIGLLN
jgi:5-methylcytosine-specific restriction enzyme subunit McrC